MGVGTVDGYSVVENVGQGKVKSESKGLTQVTSPQKDRHRPLRDHERRKVFAEKR